MRFLQRPIPSAFLPPSSAPQAVGRLGCHAGHERQRLRGRAEDGEVDLGQVGLKCYPTTGTPNSGGLNT